MKNKRWSSKVSTVKVTNRDTGRQDVHKYISDEEVEWIRLNPNLKVEVLEVMPRRHRRKDA